MEVALVYPEGLSTWKRWGRESELRSVNKARRAFAGRKQEEDCLSEYDMFPYVRVVNA